MRQILGREYRIRFVFLAAALVAVTGAMWTYARFTAPPALAGSVVTPPAQAYDFRLTNQHGNEVALSDFRGKAVVLTFLYARCPDACPLIAELLRSTSERLGDDAGKVAFVAVSVDPRGDTPDVVRTFLKVHRVEGLLTYLHGSFARLQPVWNRYYVNAGEVTLPATASRPGATLVAHSGTVYVIDPQGRIRAFLPANFEPGDLAHDLRLLARASR